VDLDVLSLFVFGFLWSWMESRVSVLSLLGKGYLTISFFALHQAELGAQALH